MMASMIFTQLNHGWNAEPNAPAPQVEMRGNELHLHFLLNPFAFQTFKEDDRGIIRFLGTTRYRLGPTNDEGWYRGQCRYSKVAPNWGEFYEIIGEDSLRDLPTDWRTIALRPDRGRHFLFYFRDETFECNADNWQFELRRANALHK